MCRAPDGSPSICHIDLVTGTPLPPWERRMRERQEERPGAKVDTALCCL